MNKDKPIRPIYIGFNQHDCEAIYRCPVCNKTIGDWTLMRTKNRCICGQLLDVR